MGISPGATTPRPVRLECADVALNGDLALPAFARGLVIFAHGSGSSRHSPRNRAVAELLQHGRLGTLLLDLLTEREERADASTAEFRFDMPLLAHRLVGAIDWMQVHPQTAPLPIGLFGASTGAAAALMAAAQRPAMVRAVVSRGGRPDLAAPVLERVRVPTLLIVGGNDEPVLSLNREALTQLGGGHRLVVVPGATHLFEEPGALETVASLAADWFEDHFRAAA